MNLPAHDGAAPVRRPLSLEQATEEAARCLLCEDAPCSRGCPAGTDPARFIRQIRFENLKGAARTIRSNNVFGYACAFTCPVENLCEHDCTRAKLDRPIDICGLQAFACDYGRRHGLEPLPRGAGNRDKVAVIGAGPAGMTCAAELAKQGYAVTIFEREGRAGGAAMWGIPAYRLPEEALLDAARGLEELGVEMRFGVEIHGAGALRELMGQGSYRACFVSTGLSYATGLDILEGYRNATTAADFLRAAKAGDGIPDLEGRHVVVIGGGSVAMDAAVTAKRLGARRVAVVVRRDLAALRANEEEVALAHKEHVVFHPNAMITAVDDEGDRILHVRGTEVEWSSTDGSIPSRAIPIVGTEFGLQADIVIQALGSQVDEEIDVIAPELHHRRDGAIAVDAGGFTGMPGVFAGGDVARGGATIAEAIGDGRRAATSIHQYCDQGRA